MIESYHSEVINTPMKTRAAGTVIFLWVLCGTLRWCSAESLTTLPRFFTADYSLHSMGARIAVMHRSFSALSNGGYLYHSETRAAGLLALIRNDIVTESSEWQFDGVEIKPVNYNYRHDGNDTKRNVEIRFDWQEKMITTTVNGSSWQMRMKSRTMDKLLYQLAIMRDLSMGKKDISYSVADGGQLKNYDFVSLGEERVQTPMGDFQAVKLERFKPGSKRSTVLWCAPELEFLPIRVESVEIDGSTTTAVIESLSVPGR